MNRILLGRFFNNKYYMNNSENQETTQIQSIYQKIFWKKMFLWTVILFSPVYLLTRSRKLGSIKYFFLIPSCICYSFISNILAEVAIYQNSYFLAYLILKDPKPTEIKQQLKQILEANDLEFINKID